MQPLPQAQVEAFEIRVDDHVLSDLHARIRNTRWPDDAPGERWSQGTDLHFLQQLLSYWADGFDWRAQERALNEFHHFHINLDGARIHFVHERAKHGVGIPLIMTHGWPSTFAELLPLVPLLTDPGAHGIDGPPFDLVIPSLPGYAFSERPVSTGVNYRYNAHLWHRLMHALGYRRYGAGGGDFGAGVATYMALEDPAPVIGIHLSNLEISPYLGRGSRPVTEAERVYLAQRKRWDAVERGYSSIQSTKPQTVGYGLTDSPCGLAAWILEKWRSWTDCRGDLEARFSADFLLTNVMLYWVTGTITSSMRDYADNRWHRPPLGPTDFVRVPTGVAVFPHMLVPEGDPPREWAERLYNVRHWTRMPSGGHFAPAEEPVRLAQDIATFFATM
jgi:pimeloyl-ACP methyl ester carboxylesterase